MNTLLRSLVLLAVLFPALPLRAAPAGTAFTYQGRLNDNGEAAAGLYDFSVELHSASMGNTTLATASVPGVTVADGVFTMHLDFGATVFDGSARWLEIAVLRQGEPGLASVLTPRQEIAPTPYALMAMKVPAGSITGSNLAPGAVGSAQIAPGAAAQNLNAGGQSGVASGGVVLSPSASAPDLLNAGYFQVGRTDLIPEKWEHLADAPDAPSTVSANAKSVWTGSVLVAWGGGTNTGARFNPATNAWTAMSTVNAPAARSGHSVVWTGTEMIVWGGTDGTNALNSGGRYHPATNTWTAMSTVSAPAARVNAPAVWTGAEVIIWGGGNEELMNTGARYSPVNNTWQTISTSGAPTARFGHSLVWTGSRVVVFGGVEPVLFEGSTVFLETGSGASYFPGANTWTPLAAGPAGIAHAAVWTGSSMIVTGGYTAFFTGDTFDPGLKAPARLAHRYTPATNTWSAINGNYALPDRFEHSAVWTGTEMIVWGGRTLSAIGFTSPVFLEGMTSTGARYNPTANTWTNLPATGAPAARSGHSASWSGTQMYITGGGQPFSGRYDLAANNWATMPGSAERTPRTQGTMVWTGSEALIWGGVDDSGLTIQSGLRFRPETGVWAAITSQSAPSARRGHSAVWTGSRMILWGGRDDATTFNDGALYDPSTDTWAPVSSLRAPSRREQHRAVWTGTEMIVWGGALGAVMQQTGSRYDPQTNVWQTMRPTGAPAGRLGFAFVWTGTEAVLWGGDFRGTPLSSGGRYHAASDTWRATSLTGVPPARTGPSAFWTGHEVIIYGGGNASDGYPSVHGRYDPATDTWTPLPAAFAPGGRAGHCAVWNGSRMIVWGGEATGGYQNYSAAYSPEANTWTTMNSSLPNIPSLRAGALHVWAGSAMLVWGGRNSTGLLKDTSTYTPAATFYLYQRP